MEMLEAGGMIDSVRKKKLISVVVIMLCMILLCACEHRGKEIEMASGDKGNAESRPKKTAKK